MEEDVGLEGAEDGPDVGCWVGGGGGGEEVRCRGGRGGWGLGEGWGVGGGEDEEGFGLVGVGVSFYCALNPPLPLLINLLYMYAI